jgi:aminobenzoyl-glutamate utilization protein B
VIARNFKKVGPPKFSEADVEFGRQLQTPLRADFGLKEPKVFNDTVEELPEKPYPIDGGSTDVGDVSWFVPTSGFGAVCFPAGSPGHSWQNVASIGSPIGHKGMLVAAKVLALSAADLLQDEKVLQEAKADFQQRMKDLKYSTTIPKGQKPPKAIR